METARSSEILVSTNQTARCKHPQIKLEIFATGHCQNLVLHEVKKKNPYEKTSFTRLSVCDVIPASKPSRIFTRFGTTFATESYPASVSWKLVETFGTLLTDSLPCLPHFSTDFAQTGYRIPVVCNATEQLRVS
jgi:hypothetical protein